MFVGVGLRLTGSESPIFLASAQFAMGANLLIFRLHAKHVLAILKMFGPNAKQMLMQPCVLVEH